MWKITIVRRIMIRKFCDICDDQEKKATTLNIRYLSGIDDYSNMATFEICDNCNADFREIFFKFYNSKNNVPNSMKIPK